MGRWPARRRDSGGAGPTKRRFALACRVAAWFVPLLGACVLACTPGENAEPPARKAAAMASAQTCIDESADGQQRTFAVGQTFEICLGENPTAGYRWRRDLEAPTVAALIGDSFEAGGGPPGASGVHRWRFRAETPGTATLGFSYRRPWETEQAPARTFALVIRVEA